MSSPPPASPPPERRLFLLLERAAHRVRERLELVARERLGVTAAQLGALMHLIGHDGARASELAAALGVQPAAVTGLCDRMVAAGLVRRRPCPDDARVQRLWLTSAGKRAAAGARPIVQAANRRLAELFTADELAVVARFLAAVGELDLAAPAAVHPGAAS
ncbi:MAG TPA: MarR family winged helix-turn-helix transcriptional regulator [Kofleriaceae bacterium]|nr:MarR family winged helix-turn-helix transcriptional regulator [Kofleriaceae bacterium]